MLNIGYYNKHLNATEKTDFVIIAQTASKPAATYIKNMYNAGYKESGITTRLEILADNELPTNYRYSD